MYYDEVPCASTEDQLEATQVRCVTSDKQEIPVEIGVLRVSKLLNEALGDSPNPKTTIPLPNINAQTFQAVVEWCKNHKGRLFVEDSLFSIIIKLKLTSSMMDSIFMP